MAAMSLEAQAPGVLQQEMAQARAHISQLTDSYEALKSAHDASQHEALLLLQLQVCVFVCVCVCVCVCVAAAVPGVCVDICIHTHTHTHTHTCPYCS